MANDALVLDDIDAFYGDSHVLHRVSMRLGEGRLLGLLGRNGAGKTTSLHVTVGLLAPRNGAVTVYGRRVTGRAPETIAAQGVALVPQGRRIFKSLTVRENLVVAGRKPRAGFPRLWSLETVYELFPRLLERQQQMAGSLSGGEQQMLAIGRALATNPRLLLLDEPTEGLAPMIVQDLLAALARLFREDALSAIIVEQHAQKVLPITDRAVILDRGRIVHQDATAALLADSAPLERLLGVTTR